MNWQYVVAAGAIGISIVYVFTKSRFAVIGMAFIYLGLVIALIVKAFL